MSEQLVTAEVAPVKAGNKTSSFLVTMAGIAVTSLPGILTYVIALAEQNADKLPANSWLSFALPVLIALGYQVTRFLTVNGERQASAKVAEAQSNAIVAQATVINTPVPESVEWQQAMPATMYRLPPDEVKFNPLGGLGDAMKDAAIDYAGGMVKDEVSQKVDRLEAKFDEFLARIK